MNFDSTQPLVSIITVVYNGEKFLEKTIESIARQTYSNIEYIIVDGGSTDGTLDIIKKNQSRISHWISEKDKGIFDAMNKGIQMAKGEIIGLLNADDYYADETVAWVVNEFQKSSAEIVHGNLAILHQNAESIMTPDITQMNSRPSIFHPTCFVRKSVYNTLGLFDIQFKISSDYEFLLRCFKKGVFFSYLPKTLCYFRPGGMSSSCASNIEGYKIMKRYNTGYQNSVIWRGIKCYAKTFLKKLIPLKNKE